MSIDLTLAQVLQILNTQPISLSESVSADELENVLSQPITAFSTDSRSVQSGEVFLALKGDRFDGHAFLTQALNQGAIAAIVNQSFLDTLESDAASLWQPKTPQAPPLLLAVNDTLVAYQAIARWWRQQFSIPVIAVTGSVGKTTTKELIAAVLATQGAVLKTEANYNNEIGVPKTLLGINPSHRFAVVELAMRGPGQIAELTQIALPDIAVITNVGTAHIGLLGSEEAIARAKCELLAEMPQTGVAILNQDNALLMETAATVWQGKTLTYGLEGGDFQGEILDPQTLRVNGVDLPLPLDGRHNALNYLAALAVAQILGIDWSNLPQPLTVTLPSGRARRHTLPGDILLLDETYNAGLESMLAALQLLADTPGQRHFAILGTMKELGDRSPEFHYQVGQAVKRLNLDGLFILADEAEATALATGAEPIPTQRFFGHTELAVHLQTIVEPGDRLLFKASRAVALDQVVDQLRTAHSPTL